ncbi:hypothetical protein [Paenarthrobacter nitroguajacolicus]|uniref:hypothetical protein n=1 Tax=Paenarthrobacter nitroguajacolicus TaxID=211146 RepID=UPI00405487AD
MTTYPGPGPTLGAPSLRREAGSKARNSPSSLDFGLALAADCQARCGRGAMLEDGQVARTGLRTYVY